MATPIIEIGKFNHLEILKETPQGLYVGDDIEEILLPNKYVSEDMKIGDFIDVFVYTDSEDRMIATTLIPNIKIGDVAYLKVKDVSSVGAFLDWGLEKDLFVPFKEQRTKMEVGESYLVFMYLDDVTDRLVGSAHINKVLELENISLEVGQEVNLLVGSETELGYQAVIDNTYRGLLYKNELFQNISPGEVTKGYVKRIRDDKKIDLTLEKQGHESIEPNADRILKKLREGEGFLPLHDKSSPDEIQQALQMSKKNFKKAIGTLYKKRIVTLEAKGIRLN